MKPWSKNDSLLLKDDPLWYKDAIIYEVHVRAFSDTNADGIGDLRGILEKLDYLQDLGVTALWLLPFYPSPLKDDGYDIANYTEVNSCYGDLNDFKLLLREAHRRGLRVITELVINHTSDQHPWFQRARYAAPGSAERDFYVWSDTPDKFVDARIMFEVEASNWTWDPVAKAYFWHRFYSHQPDLNFDHPAVHDAVLEVLDFWLDLDVDGMRLDAVPFLYEREGTNCESLPETHAFLRKLRRHIDERYRNRMLLAEATHWPEEMVTYFGAGDECHMAFHFPLMPRLFMAIRMEERFPIIDILQQTPAIPDKAQWALFLRNHDELTLAMITDEDRDYMFRMYAQDTTSRVHLGIRRRLAPLLENHRGKIELMNGLLFSLPGTPVLYYGDEIGMGDNIYLGDRNGVRTPMQWNPERNAGFSRANPQRLYLPIIIDPEYHYQNINVEAQQNNSHSLLWWMKRLIGLRKRFLAFGRGSLEFLPSENHKVLVFLRRYNDERVLVVANLSRFVQAVEVNLEEFKETVPIEMMGWTKMPPISHRPYQLTLGPYAFYWLHLGPTAPTKPGAPTTESVLEVLGTWQDLFRAPAIEDLERILLTYMRGQPWFVSRGGESRSARIIEQIPLSPDSLKASIALVQVEYADGEPRNFTLPLAFGAPPAEKQAPSNLARAVICRLTLRSDSDGEIQAGVLYDPLGEKNFSTALLEAFAHHRRFWGTAGDLQAWTTTPFHHLRDLVEPRPEPALMKAEQDNTSIAYGNQVVLKLFRCVEEGVNLEAEVGQALANKTSFTHLAPVAGGLDYRSGQRLPMTLGVLFGFIPNEGDAWRYTQDSLRRFFEHILTHQIPAQEPFVPDHPVLDLVAEDLPANVTESIGTYLEAARLMGRRTGELHVAFASIIDDSAFRPEPFTPDYQRSLFQTVRSWVYRIFNLLRQRMPAIPQETRAAAQLVLGREADFVRHLRTITGRPLSGKRIRCHGDFRLGSLLHTGKDFMVIDFEGEPLRTLSNRRHKRSPLRDVASMLHSLNSAVHTALLEGHLRPEDKAVLEPWARFWELWTSVAFVKEYLEAARSGSFLQRSREEMQLVLDFHLMARGIFELQYQLLNHPARVQIPLQTLLHLINQRDRRLAAS